MRLEKGGWLPEGKSRFSAVFEALKIQNFFSKKSIALLCFFSVFVVATAVLAVGRCVPCKINHYCWEGLRYQCPIDRPVTKTVRTASIDGCLTCNERNGNSDNPVYDDLVGDCVSCVEFDSSKPHWNGSECISCVTFNEKTPIWDLDECVSCYSIDNTKPVWNGASCEVCPAVTSYNPEKEKCECPQVEGCAHNLYDSYNDKCLCLVENVKYQVFEDIAPKSAEEETEEFLATYGIKYAAADGIYPDYWAGAKKYCQDKGLRLPTMQELLVISDTVFEYKRATTCNSSCASSGETGCCWYSASPVNVELFAWLRTSASEASAISNSSRLWSTAEDTASKVYSRDMYYDGSYYNLSTRNDNNKFALCVK